MADPKTPFEPGFSRLTAEVRAGLDEIYAQKLAAAQGFAPVKPHGTVYYVSSEHGNDANAGTSPESPWKTLSNCADRVERGDTILLECGSVFRRSENAPFIFGLKNGVTLASYGEGKKPILYGSLRVSADQWQPTETPDVYYFDGEPLDLNIYSDVGAIVFGEGEAWGIKTLQTFSDPETKKAPDGYTLALEGADNGLEIKDLLRYPFACGADLRGDLSFFHDYKEKRIYLRSEGGNPAKRFSSVELSLSRFAFVLENPAVGVTFQNLDFRNFGSHVIRPLNCENVTVQNCEFRFVGGTIMPDYGAWRNYYTRLGNAVENWNSCNGLTVEACYFDQIYDTAVTTQSNSEVVSKNIVCKNNVAERFWWGIELWTVKGAEFSGVDVSGNYFKKMGEGFATQRPDKIDPGTNFSVNAFVTVSGGPYEMRHSFSVTGNYIDGTTGKFFFCSSPKTNRTDDGVRFDGNTYVASTNADLARLFGKFDHDGGVTYPYTAEGVNALQALGIEPKGKFYY